MLIRNADPVVVETVQPVVERTTIVERDNWYSEPWAVALIVGLLVVVGLVTYYVGFASNTSPAVVSTNTITREKDVPTPSTNTPVIVNNPAPSSSRPVIVNNPPASSSTPSVNITNTTPAAPSSAGSDSSANGTSSNSSSDQDNNGSSSSSSDNSSSGSGSSSSGSSSNNSSDNSGQ